MHQSILIVLLCALAATAIQFPIQKEGPLEKASEVITDLEIGAAGVGNQIKNKAESAAEEFGNAVEGLAKGSIGALEIKALVKLLIKKIVMEKEEDLDILVSGEPMRAVRTFIRRVGKLLKVLTGVALLLGSRSLEANGLNEPINGPIDGPAVAAVEQAEPILEETTNLNN